MQAQPTVLITGTSRGLGLAMLMKFAEAGYRVAGCARTSDSFEALQTKFGSQVLLRRVDVTQKEAVQTFADEVISHFGAPDLLINSAAMVNRPAPLWEVTAEEMSALFEVNLLGVSHVIRSFVPAMIARKRGVIVNFSSGWGRSTSPGVAPYCASKWAIEGLTQALAQDLPAGLSAVAFNPGIIDTAMLRICLGEDSAMYPEPDEWASVAVPYLMKLNAADNGNSLTCPGH
jgi:NAD(P)-dependent dehydrogenase (short-subunit alcohol dehydrogenase family)